MISDERYYTDLAFGHVHPLAEMQQILDKWQRISSDAKMWLYLPSFAQLHIRIEKAGHPGNIHVICVGCINISGPTGWENAALKVQEFTRQLLHNSQGPMVTESVTVSDEKAGMKVICGKVFIAEDVKPIFW